MDFLIEGVIFYWEEWQRMDPVFFFFLFSRDLVADLKSLPEQGAWKCFMHNKSEYLYAYGYPLEGVCTRSYVTFLIFNFSLEW